MCGEGGRECEDGRECVVRVGVCGEGGREW